MEATGKTQLLKLTQDITNLGINLYYTRQPHPAGLGDSIYRARNFVGEEPFVVMLSDDLMKEKVTLTKQLIDEYDKTHASTIAVMKVPHKEVSKYGVIDPGDMLDKDLYNVKKFVEKPAVDKAQVTSLLSVVICLRLRFLTFLKIKSQGVAARFN